MRFVIMLILASALFAVETIAIDASANRRRIDPLIYGVAWASAEQLAGLNATANRWGGNTATRYNWQVNADNRGGDWFFQSIPSAEGGATAGGAADAFILRSRAGGAEPMITIPIVDWVARLGTNRSKLCSFSIAKYGPQDANDWQWMPDAGNGRRNGVNLVGNDPRDANAASDVVFQRTWIGHLIGSHGTAAAGGVRWYLLDNEPALWNSTHRDIHPEPAGMDEVWTRMSTHAASIRAAEPGAVIVGPEEWSIVGCLVSGRDQAGSWTAGPDRQAHGGMDYLPWLLKQFRDYQTATGVRLLDVATTHCYPNGGEFSDDVSSAMQTKRNRSTRILWDPAFNDGSWLNDIWPDFRINLIPRLRAWVDAWYPGTRIGITEYNWGAEGHINGATTLADIWGIFGREGLDCAAYWSCPPVGSPVYKAMQMYRNYDGARSTFGDISVRAAVADPDRLSSFAALRGSDGALTVMVINKIATAQDCRLTLAGFAAGPVAEVWQLTAANSIARRPDLAVAGGRADLNVPVQSITLLVMRPANAAPQVAGAAGSPSALVLP